MNLTKNWSYKKTVVLVSIFALVLLCIVALIVFRARPSQALTGKPNIVVFMTDDQTKETYRVMQKTQQLLAGRGVTFQKNITSYNLCCPSRASYYTGQYSHNNGVKDNSGPNGGYQSYRNQSTAMPASLKNAGYKTIHIGKYLNGTGIGNPSEIPDGWSDYRGMTGSGTYYNYTLNINGQVRNYGTAPQDYLTDVMRDQAINALSNTGDTPFYLNVGFFGPHYQGEDSEDNTPATAPIPAPRHLGLFTTEQLPPKPSYQEANVADKPAYIRRLSSTNTTALPGVSIIKHYRSELRTLQSVDEAIEAVVNKVSEMGKLDNTIFIFTSDNGYFHGEHRIPSKKYFPYEEGINTPLIITLPNSTARQDTTHLVSNIDLAPTILDFAGVSPNRVMDGHSLKSVLNDPNISWSRPVLLEGEKNTSTHPRFKGVRTDRYVYIEYPATGEKELYDLVVDPYQISSKHRNTAYSSIMASLKSKLNFLKNCVGSSCDVVPLGFYESPQNLSAINFIARSVDPVLTNEINVKNDISLR